MLNHARTPRRSFLPAAAIAVAFVCLTPALAKAQLGRYIRGSVAGANDLRGDWVAAGVGMRGSGGSGTITLSGIPPGSIVKEALLYWLELTNERFQPGAANLTLDGHAVTGNFVGVNSSPDPNILFATGYRADVTRWISGNGSYSIANALDSGSSSTPPVCDGASLIVTYSNGSSPIKDIVIYDGAELVTPTNPRAHTLFTGFRASNPITSASLGFVIGNGQPGLTDDVLFANQPIASNIFDGSDAPANIAFWDTDTVSLQSLLSPDATNLSADIDSGASPGDSLVWVASPFSVSSPIPAVDVVTEILTPQVPETNRFLLRITATNNTSSPQPIFASIVIRDRTGEALGSLVNDRGGTLPPNANVQGTLSPRIPDNIAPRFHNVPLYVVTTISTRPSHLFLDDDFAIVYIVPN